MKEIIEIPLEKLDWENTIQQNKNLIRTNQIQILMASNIIRMCEKKLLEFEPAKVIGSPNNSKDLNTS